MSGVNKSPWHIQEKEAFRLMWAYKEHCIKAKMSALLHIQHTHFYPEVPHSAPETTRCFMLLSTNTRIIQWFKSYRSGEWGEAAVPVCSFLSPSNSTFDKREEKPDGRWGFGLGSPMELLCQLHPSCYPKGCKGNARLEQTIPFFQARGDMLELLGVTCRRLTKTVRSLLDSCEGQSAVAM